MTDNIETREQQETQLAELFDKGAYAASVQFITWLNAKDRHEARVAATKAAADEVELAPKEEEADRVLKRVVVLTMDLVGYGGPFNCGWTRGEGGASDRILIHLGKGRWHASDGGAYRAAANRALRDDKVFNEPLMIHVREDHMVFTLNYDSLTLTYTQQPRMVRDRMRAITRCCMRYLWEEARGVEEATDAPNACFVPGFCKHLQPDIFVPKKELVEFASFYDAAIDHETSFNDVDPGYDTDL